MGSDEFFPSDLTNFYFHFLAASPISAKTGFQQGRHLKPGMFREHAQYRTKAAENMRAERGKPQLVVYQK